MSELLRDPFSLIVIVIVAGGFLAAMFYQIRVRTSGTEAIATVTLIEEKEQHDADGTYSRYDEVHVVYRTASGQFAEGILANPAFSVSEGDRIRVKYVDDHPEAPVYLGKEK